MATLQHNLSGYRNLLRFSSDRHLLVEGSGDKHAFRVWLDELFQRTASPNIDAIQIDSAESLIEFGQAGNRKKVEMVCNGVSGEPYADRLVGFVDREFREFRCDPQLVDCIEGHRISDRLVWSRGHSIENYYFDFDTLRRPLRQCSSTDRFREALDLFEAVFEETIRLACAASLAGHEIGMLSLVRGSVRREFLLLDRDAELMLSVDRDVWRFCLTQHQGCTAEIADQLLGKFEFWNQRTRETDFDAVRWMCHGHIGLAFIWAAYSRCVLDVCRAQGEGRARAEASSVLQAQESLRFNACAEQWVARSLGGHCSYPVEVFELLGLDVQTAC